MFGCCDVPFAGDYDSDKCKMIATTDYYKEFNMTDSTLGKISAAFLVVVLADFITTYDFNIALLNIELLKAALNK